ncbi:MAG: hypothetical protein ACE5E6_04410 [Phycisphaerae bacterium]
MRIYTRLAAACITIAGCGVPQVIRFPDQVIGVDGQVFTLDELEAIAQDENLTEAQKRASFEDLGILDPDLIDALLAL